jgi:hypothetical protein
MHNFKDSLIKGQAGEALFLQYMPHLQKLDGRQSDFVDSLTGERYELKTDSYDPARTPNMFIEHYSDVSREKPGGPLQALAHGSTYWCYFFPKALTCYIFVTSHLLEALPRLTADLELKLIRNRGWTTSGWAVPRTRLQHLYKEVHFE